MTRKIMRAVLSAFVLIVLFLMMNGYVRKMTYPAPSFRVPSPPPKPFQEVWLQTESGSRVHAWHYQSADAGAPALIYFHGNGETLETLRLSGLLHSVIALNVSFLAIDYPGYGRSEGKPSEQNLRDAGIAAARWTKEKHPDSPLIACGWSLGAAVAIDVAARQPEHVNGLIAMSAWSSLHDVATRHFPSWMVRLMLQESYDSLKAASKIQCPSLFIHGENDTLIPAEQGKKVADALHVKAIFVQLPGVSHNDLLDHSQVWREIASFLKSVTSAV